MAKPNTEIVQQPSVRTATTWTPALLRVALSSADSGSLRLIADLCDTLLGDDRINGVFETRIGGLLGLPLGFEAAGDGRRRGRAVRALEAEEDWWAAFPEDELQQFLTWGRLLGCSFARLEWTAHRGRVIPVLRFWHPRNMRFDWQARRWYARVGDGGTEEPIEAGDGTWVVYTPYGAFRPWARGLWRGLSRWWLLKSYAIDDWGNFGEGASKTVATSAVETTAPQRKELAADLYACARNAMIVLPKGFDLKLVEAQASTVQIYSTQVSAADTGFAVQVLGQNLTTEVTGGSFAAASVHGKVEHQRIKADAETASTTIHDQALTWWAEFNFGNRELAPWPIWPTDTPEDRRQKADVMVAVATAIEKFSAQGITLDTEVLTEDFGIPIKEIRPPAPGTKARAARTTRVSKGPSGFLEGQSYADAVADHGARHGAPHLRRFASELMEALEDVETLDEARVALLKFYGTSMPPEKLAAMAERLFVMAQLGGMFAVRQDVPELDDEEADDV